MEVYFKSSQNMIEVSGGSRGGSLEHGPFPDPHF